MRIYNMLLKSKNIIAIMKAMGEKSGKIKFKDLETFVLDIGGLKHQFIVNKGSRFIQFDLNGVQHQSVNPMIIFINNGDMVSEVEIKTFIADVDQVKLNETLKTYTLNELSKTNEKPLKLLSNELINEFHTDKKYDAYAFKIDFNGEPFNGFQGVSFRNMHGNVYSYLDGEEETLGYISALTSCVYDQETHAIYTNYKSNSETILHKLLDRAQSKLNDYQTQQAKVLDLKKDLFELSALIDNIGEFKGAQISLIKNQVTHLTFSIKNNFEVYE